MALTLVALVALILGRGPASASAGRSISVSFDAEGCTVHNASNSSSSSSSSSSSASAVACSVELRSAISHNPCVQGRATSVTYRGTTYHYPNGTFGADCTHNRMWTIGGCRAEFSCGKKDVAFQCSSESYIDRHYCELTATNGCIVVPTPPPPLPPPPPAPGPALPPLRIGMKTYLLLDSRNVIGVSGDAKLVLGPVWKDPLNPVIKEDRPWEMRFDNMQPSVWYDPAVSGWRCWYNSFSRCGPKGYANTHDCQRGASDCTTAATANTEASRSVSEFERAAVGSSGRQGVMCTAISRNGSIWTKPNLGLVRWGTTPATASTANNIILDFSNISVAGSPGAQGPNPWGITLDQTADATERWKAFGMLGEMEMVTGVSRDGLTWRTRKVYGTQGKFDTHANVIWDETTQKWVGHARCNPTAGTHGHSEGGSHHTRVQCFTESALSGGGVSSYSMTNWSVFMPTGLNSSNNAQPDALTVFRYAGIYLGFANVFNPFLGTGASDPSAPLPGTVNMELAWSADARRWRYAVPGQSFVPHVPGGGSWDCCGVFGAKQSPEDTPEFVDGQQSLPVFYAGCNGRL